MPIFNQEAPPYAVQLVTSSGNVVVPSWANRVEVDIVGGGSSGAGGHATGGGGGGGGSSGIFFGDAPVTPGSTLTVTIGAGGATAAIGANGNPGGASTVTGALLPFPRMAGDAVPTAGAAANGGNGGNGRGANGGMPAAAAVAVGGAAAGTPGVDPIPFGRALYTGTPGGAGAGTGSGGGGLARSFLGTSTTSGGANIGGGAGGGSYYGQGGVGGATGANGVAAASTAYGAAGGGGGQNGTGGAGANGIVVLRFFPN